MDRTMDEEKRNVVRKVFSHIGIGDNFVEYGFGFIGLSFVVVMVLIFLTKSTAGPVNYDSTFKRIVSQCDENGNRVYLYPNTGSISVVKGCEK